MLDSCALQVSPFVIVDRITRYLTSNHLYSLLISMGSHKDEPISSNRQALLHASLKLMTHSSLPTGPEQSLVVHTQDYKDVFGRMFAFPAVIW